MAKRAKLERVDPSGTGRLHRLAFRPPQLADVLRFCAREGCRFEPALVERLLLRTTRSSDGVFLLASEGTDELALVAAVIDVGSSSQSPAILEVLAARSGLDAHEVGRHLLGPAIAWARSGGRQALETAASGGVSGLGPVLASAGFSLAHEEVRMERAAGVPLPEPSRDLPPGFVWDVLDRTRAAEAHAALAEIFAATPLSFLSALDVFQEAVSGCSIMGRLLLDEGKLAGLVQWVPGGDPVALRTVGLRAGYRGRGLGAALMEEVLRQPGVAGRMVTLETEAQNRRALALYQRFEFKICARVAWLRLPLR